MSFPFWSTENFQTFNRIALETEEYSLSYDELDKEVDNLNKILSNYGLKNHLAFLPMQSDKESIVRYLACLRGSIVPLMLPSDTDESLLSNLIKIYQPSILFGQNGIDDIQIYESNLQKDLLPDELAILLSTSGSTGSSKLVRLSYTNIESNADAISEYLQIDSYQKAFCTLPLSYSYGISILNSHFKSGACIRLSSLSPFDNQYYHELIESRATSISGVPFFYQMLFRTGFFEKKIPSLKVMTQAGGKLSEKLALKFSEYANQHAIDFYIMYGQTEATARISYVPSKKLGQKIGSVGIAIPGGELSLSKNKELIYIGPNVMLGYAKNRKDLLANDKNLGKLHTGDIGEQDEDGYFYITGRLKRFIKLAGTRLGLDELEMALEEAFELNFLVTGKDDRLIIEVEDLMIDLKKISEFLQIKFSINRSFMRIHAVQKIRRKSNGKKDYSIFKDYS